MVFCFIQKFFFGQHKSQNFFLLRKSQNFFQNLTLGYMTKTLNQIFFFSSTKIRIFFSATLGIRIFFQKKNHNPPCKLNGPSLIIASNVTFSFHDITEILLIWHSTKIFHSLLYKNSSFSFDMAKNITSISNSCF